MRDGYSGAQAAAFFEKLLDRVKRLPSVVAATLTDTVPVAVDGNPGAIFSDAAAGGERATHSARRHAVGRDYLRPPEFPSCSGAASTRKTRKMGQRQSSSAKS